MERNLPDAEPAPLDFEELLARCLGNIEFAERVLVKFQQRFGDDLTELEQGVASQDAERVAQVAHRLKGASANAGAPSLRVQASEIEKLARARCVSEIPARVDRLRGEWIRFADSLSSLGLSAGTVP